MAKATSKPKKQKVIVTQEILDLNPEMVEAGVQVGDEIEIEPEASVGAIPNHVALKGVLERHPHVHTLFVNEAGDWHFQERPGFLPLERSEILK